MASGQLRNCLKNWWDFKGMVWGILKNDKYEGAIEISGSNIVQVRLAENVSIETDEKIYNAYCIWREKYNLMEEIRPYI